MSPEFRRNLWLEFSLNRLFAMPLVLGALFLLTYLFNQRLLDGDSARIAAMAYIVIAFLWGTRLAAESVVAEINHRTWDLQRMSAIGAWDMAWGKLFGSTAYAWYGGLLCLGFYAVSFAGVLPAEALAGALFLYLASGVLAHAICLLVSLLAIQRRRAFGRIHVASYQFLGLACAIPALYVGLSGLGEDGILRLVTWYGQPYPLFVFAIVALAAATAWAVIGVHALMRVELQQENPPWLWLAFVAGVMALASGIEVLPWGAAQILSPIQGSAMIAFVAAAACTYLVALGEAKSRLIVRRLGHLVATAQWERLLAAIPRSLLTLPVVIGAAAIAIATARVSYSVAGGADIVEARVSLAAVLLFVLRDIAFIHWLILARPAGRGEAGAALFLLLSYTVVPAILTAVHLGPLVAAFLPRWGEDPMLTILPVAAELAVVTWLLVRAVHKTLSDRII